MNDWSRIARTVPSILRKVKLGVLMAADALLLIERLFREETGMLPELTAGPQPADFPVALEALTASQGEGEDALERTLEMLPDPGGPAE